MKSTDQTKDEWMEQQKAIHFVAGKIVSVFWMGMMGSLAFGIACIFLSFTQAFGCGITSGVLSYLVVSAISGIKLRKILDAELSKMTFSDSPESSATKQPADAAATDPPTDRRISPRECVLTQANHSLP